MAGLDTPVIWHTPSAVYACTVETLLKVVSGFMEGYPELCNSQYSFLRLLDDKVKAQAKKTLNQYGEQVTVIKAPRAGHERELYNIEDIALRRLSSEQHVPVTKDNVLKGGAL